MAKKTKTSETAQEQKIVTKYDRKVQRRKEEERKAKRNHDITVFTSVAVAAAVIICIILASISSYNRIHKEYISIDNDPISQIEFDFYYAVAKSDMLNTTLYGTMTYESYFTSYMGYDSSKADAKQSYASTENTWYDYFANATVTKIKEFKALIKAADAAGFTYDTAQEDYDSFVEGMNTQAANSGLSLKEYYKETFGGHATEKNLKESIQTYLKAVAYQEQLQTEFAATDEEITAYYNENKADYDTVDYRSLAIKAETADDTASMEAAKKKAEEMAAAVTDEASFAELCKQYAAEDEKEKYADTTASLNSGVSKASLNTELADWLFAEGRTAGEVTVIEDTANLQYTVLYFVNRSYDSANNETIASQLLSQRYNELITGYTEEMTVENKKNRIKMLAE